MLILLIYKYYEGGLTLLMVKDDKEEEEEEEDEEEDDEWHEICPGWTWPVPQIMHGPAWNSEITIYHPANLYFLSKLQFNVNIQTWSFIQYFVLMMVNSR